MAFELSPPAALGSRWSTSATDDSPVRWIDSASTVMTGEGCDSGSRRMRDPVTTISSPLV
ncbi:hypothetical protein [Sphingomonas sp. LR55]|uniref:hypothetical protein n=1 Tax=Sphingomonas sp. LR55 TaxID=3050231 RepID=UPI002FE1B8D6